MIIFIGTSAAFNHSRYFQFDLTSVANSPDPTFHLAGQFAGHLRVVFEAQTVSLAYKETVTTWFIGFTTAAGVFRVLQIDNQKVTFSYIPLRTSGH